MKNNLITQEDKLLLLKDLCMRLPYGVRFNYGGYSGCDYTLVAMTSATVNEFPIADCKPYLRPMSSMTEEEVKELLFVRLASKYGESCAYIKKFIKLNEISFRKEYTCKESITVWFSFENKIHDTSQIIEYSKCEYLGQINNITLAEIDWLNAHHFDFRGLITKGLAIETNKDNNPYK